MRGRRVWASLSDVVSGSAAFKRPDNAYDDTHYLSNEGDHPNTAGHQQIADTSEAVIETALG
jgi:phospholipase/lecithinase/hemolysin